MSGVELIVGGWFASALIGKFVNATADYLGGKHRLHKETKEMLKNVRNTLPLMQAIMEAAANQNIQNDGLNEWLRRVNEIAYEAEDVLDDFKAQMFRKNLKGKVSRAATSFVHAISFYLLETEVKKLKAVVKELDQLCKESSIFAELLHILTIENRGQGQERTNSGKVTKCVSHKLPLLFGRKREIELILTIVEGEFIIKRNDNSVRASNMSNTRISVQEVGQNVVGTVRKHWSRLFGKIEGYVGTGSSREISENSKLKGGIEVSPQPNETRFNKNKLGSKTKIENMNLSSSRGKTQKSLAMDPTQQMGHYGMPFVIPIVGSCGIGKTALAQKIYETLEGQFEIRWWVCMQQQFNVAKLVQEFNPSFRNNDSQLSLQDEIVRNIEGKKFFLVLDDVPGEPYCSQLLDLLTWFTVGAYGSVILITTRERNHTIRSIWPIFLEPIEGKDFLSLLEYYTFQNANVKNEQKNTLMPILENIGKKLCGSPLAAKRIGALLGSNLDISKWTEISKNLSFQSSYSVASDLEIRYKSLNANLKRCFNFCLVFPKNTTIERDRLVQMWIANNFIQPNSNDTSTGLEVIGNKCFDELVNGSFFLPTPFPNMYIMHNEVRELATAISNHESFVIDCKTIPCLYGCSFLNEHVDSCPHGYFFHDNDSHELIPPNTRYLTVRKNNLSIDFEGGAMELRTALLDGIPPKEFGKILNSMTKLRVLKLSHHGGQMNTICKQLSHLRFLDLSFTGITELPDSICTLFHLQVLNIEGCKFEKLPKNMNQLINLRHLYASKETIVLISGIGKLTNLQELEEFKITKKEGHKISELAEMKEIGGHLSVVGLENVEDDVQAKEAKLAKKQYLKLLSLQWVSNQYYSNLNKENANKILFSLLPHSALTELEIVHYPGTKLPSWTTHADFVTLKLVLEDLKMDAIGEEFYGDDQKIFPALKILKFVNIKSWKVWMRPADQDREWFPLLKDLEIRDCFDLKIIPLRSLNLSSLKKLVLSNCSSTLLKESMHDNLPNLRFLSLEKLDVRFIGNSQSLPNLKKMILKDTTINWNGMPVLPKLIEIGMYFSVDIIDALKNLGEIMDISLSTLKVLSIIHRPLSFTAIKEQPMLEAWFAKLPHLVELTADVNLPELGFSTLASLKRHKITGDMIPSIPEGGMPSDLKELHIREVSGHFNKQFYRSGKHWPKIKHIPYIVVNGQTIQKL